ncbi:MAG: hypothetical protein P0120_01490 [Nitrospira sp.]|nr:hypothetical protein [Nitrospira sp.]
MAPKFATPGKSDPSAGANYSVARHSNGSFCTFKWENPHGIHGSVVATNWKIWIGINAGGGEKYKTQVPIPNNGPILSDDKVPINALPVGTSLWVTPKYQKSDGTWNDGTPTKFNVVE